MHLAYACPPPVITSVITVESTSKHTASAFANSALAAATACPFSALKAALVEENGAAAATAMDCLTC